MMMVVLAARVSGSGLNRVPLCRKKRTTDSGGLAVEEERKCGMNSKSIQYTSCIPGYKDVPSGRRASGDEDGDRQLNYGLFRVAMC